MSDISTLLRRLQAAGPLERRDAAERLAARGTREAFDAALGLLSHEDDSSSVVEAAIADGLVDGRPLTVPFCVERLRAAPASRDAALCAYALGEIAYHQGRSPDRAVLPALLAGLEAQLPVGTTGACPYIAALREYARVAPVPGAAPLVRSLLTRAEHERTPYLVALDNALELLDASEGRRAVLALRDTLGGRPSPLMDAIDDFLARPTRIELASTASSQSDWPSRPRPQSH